MNHPFAEVEADATELVQYFESVVYLIGMKKKSKRAYAHRVAVKNQTPWCCCIHTLHSGNSPH